MNDTHPEAERIWIELLRKAGPERRLAMAMELTNDVLRRARAGIARAHPDLTEQEQKLLFARIHYGDEIADRVEEYLRRRTGVVAVSDLLDRAEREAG